MLYIKDINVLTNLILRDLNFLIKFLYIKNIKNIKKLFVYALKI